MRLLFYFGYYLENSQRGFLLAWLSAVLFLARLDRGALDFFFFFFHGGLDVDLVS